MDGERTDEELLLSIAAAPGALPEFYLRHVGRMIAFGARRFGGPEDVADFVAEVFLEVLESAPRFDPRRGRALPWLYGLAANVAAQERRRAARAADASRRLSGRALLDPDDGARIEERIDAAARLRETYGLLGQLPAGERHALELVALDGLAPASAAEALGISPIALRVRLHRARSRLRRLLDTPRPDPGTSAHSTEALT